ncbi:MAG: hypothetical protein ACI9TV_003250 [Sulfurimonas sp.]|jgi:hypothetical protein
MVFEIYETDSFLVISQSPRRPIIYPSGEIIAHDKRYHLMKLTFKCNYIIIT